MEQVETKVDVLAGTGFRLDEEESRDFVPTWVHETEPVWIREYEPVAGVRLEPNFYVYRAVRAPKRGNRPWSVDNVGLHSSISPPHTLHGALEIACSAISRVGGGK